MAEESTGGAKAVVGPLSKKVGGQPAWLWIIGVVVLAIGVQWYRKQSAAAKAAATQLVPSATPLAQDPATEGTGTLPAGAPYPTPAEARPLSTSGWLQAALNAVKSTGQDPIDALGALDRFLNGGNLSYQDTLTVNAAVDAVGVPPGFTSIPQGNWQTRPMPAAAPTIVGFVKPAGSATTFAKYSDGSLVSLEDSNSTGAALASAKARGINTTVQVLPINDPIWQNADVVKNPTLGAEYLWGQQWANYVDPNEYAGMGRPGIISDANVETAAQQAWNRSQDVLPATWQWGTTQTTESNALANKAYNAAFPGTSPA